PGVVEYLERAAVRVERGLELAERAAHVADVGERACPARLVARPRPERERALVLGERRVHLSVPPRDVGLEVPGLREPVVVVQPLVNALALERDGRGLVVQSAEIEHGAELVERRARLRVGAGAASG